MKTYPSITIVTSTLNANLKLFEKVLKSIKLQNYPRQKIEHIVFDGGSTNGTIELATRNNCDVTVLKSLKFLAQVRQSLAIRKAQGELILILESDNVLTSSNWLIQLVRPIIENNNIFCSYSAYCGYDTRYSLTTRYGALFGTCDPVLYYLGKCDKIPLLQERYSKGSLLKSMNSYWVIKFTKDTLLTMGDNGFLIRRNILNKVNDNPNSYIHVDAFARLLRLGYDTYGVVKNTIVHVQPSNIFDCAKSRFRMKQQFYNEKRNNRTYIVYDWKSNQDRMNLLKYVFFSVTFIIPLFESINGFRKKNDGAWFLHPVMCLIMMLAYGFSELQWLIRNEFKRLYL